MFRSARLRLTAWYMLMIMWVSVVFSAVIYSMISFQIEGMIRRQNERITRMQNESNVRPGFRFAPNMPPFISTDELENQKKQLLVSLLFVNVGIAVLVGGASYILSGKTLKPIAQMVEEQNQFISDSSHELRTPIATMRAEMEQQLLEKHITDKAARTLITSNLEELTSLQNLTNNLLQLAKVHPAQSEKETTIVSVAETIHQAIKKVSPIAKVKSLTIEPQITDAFVRGVQQSLVQVWVILLDNAIKYSPEHTTIAVVMKKKDHSVQVSVKDEGVGIAPKDLPHIFDRFFRSDASRSQVNGYGLGLSIAKKIVSSMRGTISARKNSGKGMTFIVSLPSGHV